MALDLVSEAKKAITAEIKLQDCYRRMKEQTSNPKVRAVLHDLLLMEEMNEVLIRSLHQKLQA